VSTPPADWTTGVREGTMPVGAVAAAHEIPETPDPIVSPGLPDARADTVSASAAGAMASAEARFLSHQQGTFGLGSTIGTVLDLTPVVSDMSKHTGSPGADGSGPAG
jgi:hypothetical protein